LKEDKPTRAAVYCRVSGEEQRQSETIENQVDFARNYCGLHGIPIVDLYKDDGVSGALPLQERPEGSRLLLDAKRGLFDLVLVYRLDRFSRKTMHLLSAYELLESLGVGLRSMTESFDTSSPSGTFTMTMFASIAALERDTLLERTAMGRRRKARQGRWAWGGRPPLGYRLNEDGYPEIEPEEAEVVKLIFRLYVEERMDTVALSDYLNARGVPVSTALRGSGNGGRWRAARVSWILSCTAYKGEYTYRSDGEEIDIELPPIVSEETWERAAQLRRRNKKRARRNLKRRYLLRGLIRCADCGSAYAGDGSTSRPYSYYRCTGSSNVNRRLDHRCTARSVRAEDLDEIVWRDIKGFVRNPGPLIAELQAKLNEERESRPDVEEELSELQRQIASKKDGRGKVVNLYRRGIIDEDEAETELLILEREAKALEDRRQELLAHQRQNLRVDDHLMTVRGLLDTLRDRIERPSWQTKRELVETLVERVSVDTVEQDGRKRPLVTVRYRFVDPDSYCSSHPLRDENITDRSQSGPTLLDTAPS